jgi:hypothetical protein
MLKIPVFVISGLIAIAIILALYFLPSIIAARRNHLNRVAIYALNFFLGWSVIAWILCLVWALSNSSPQVVVVQQNAAPPAPPAPAAPQILPPQS